MRSPAFLLTSLAVTISLLIVAGAWLVWRIVEQERLVERQRQRQRLEELADFVTVGLRGTLSELEQRVTVLSAAGSWTSELESALDAPGLAAVLETTDAITVRPPRTLLYRPWLAEATEPPAEPFRPAERAELVHRNHRRAIALLRDLADSPDETVRAGALVRIARNQRKLGAHDEALATYAELGALGSAGVDGLPASLVALHGRCSLAARTGALEILTGCTRRLREELFSGRWPLPPGAFEFYRAGWRDWVERLGDESTLRAPERRRLLLSAAIEELWHTARTQDATGRLGSSSDAKAPAAGTRSLRFDDRSVVVVWRHGSTGLAGLAATDEHLGSVLGAEVAPALARQGTLLEVTRPDGTPVVTLGTTERNGIDFQDRVVRTAAETELPWNLRLAAARVEGAGMPPRQSFLLGAFAATVLVIAVAGYAAFRAIGRELAVARQQSEFVAAVSHEFRSPLASVRQMSELLTEGRVPDADRQRRYFRTIERETIRLQRLVENLLDFGRMEAGVRTYRMEPVDAAALVERLGREFAAEPVAEGHELSVEASPESLPVEADREALERALWNLLDNAVKYSPAGGPIRLQAERRDGRVDLRVVDRGVGIPDEEQGEIFGKFVRGREASDLSVGGTGLGLALVRHIAEAHRGEISVESAPGEGSTFTLSMPLAEEER